MRECEGFVMNIGANSGSSADLSVRKNIQRQLATRLQEITQEHRLMQRTYMENLKKLNAGENPTSLIPVEDDLQMQDEFEDMDEIAKERDEGINILVNNINELSMIFKDLSALVLHQGTILDRIDYNIEQAKEHTGKGVQELAKADKHQRSTRATSCMLCLIVGIVILALMLIYKDT